MLIAYVVALVLAPAADVPVICPEQARAYAGKDVIVQGRVDQVGDSRDGKALLLNFRGLYPWQLFTAVIFSKSLQAFPEARTWEGKTIKVRGKIQLFEQGIPDARTPASWIGPGSPEIILGRSRRCRPRPERSMRKGMNPSRVANP